MLDYNALAADYARHRQVHPSVLRDLIGVPALHTESQVLEVGCGTGNYIHRICETTGCAGKGIDPSEQMLARARARGGKMAFAQARAEKTDEPDSAYDLCFSVDVIHHVSDRSAYFAEAWRILRMGGMCCTVTDSEFIIRNRRPLSTYFPETIEAELQRYPPIATLMKEMSAADFTSLSEVEVEFAYALTEAAPYRDKAYSALHLISNEAHARGMQRLMRDLRIGPVECVSRYVLLWGVRTR